MVFWLWKADHSWVKEIECVEYVKVSFVCLFVMAVLVPVPVLCVVPTFFERHDTFDQASRAISEAY